MTKIIPFALAVIIVLGVGFYLFTSNLSKTQTTGEVQNLAPSSTEVSDGNPEGTPTPNVNQITLTVTSPANNTTVVSSSLTVRGTTLPGAEVSVNEKDVVAGGNGNFSATISLEEGDNYIIVVAVDADGNVAEAELNVTYAPA